MTRQGTTAEKIFHPRCIQRTALNEVSTLRHERFHRRALLKAQASGPGVDNARFARRIQDMLTIFRCVGNRFGQRLERWFFVTASFGSASMVRGNYAAYCIFAQHFTNTTIDAMSSDGSVRRPRIRTDSERDRRQQK